LSHIKLATSVGANYRAACRGRSKAEFYSKICIVVEEADETEYWLELILETNLSKNNHEVIRLLKESNEITKILTKAKSTTYMNN
jgi:four helix bundle protein